MFAEVLTSGHAVVLTCWQTAERAPEQVCWFSLVVGAVARAHVWAHDACVVTLLKTAFRLYLGLFLSNSPKS